MGVKDDWVWYDLLSLELFILLNKHDNHEESTNQLSDIQLLNVSGGAVKRQKGGTAQRKTAKQQNETAERAKIIQKGVSWDADYNG